MSKTKSFTIGASIKSALLVSKAIAYNVKEITKAKAKQAQQAAKDSKQEFVKGYNSIS
jgi:hypothetical protein